MEFTASNEREQTLRQALEKRTDIEAARMRRYLAMPDLSRAPASPLNELVRQTLTLPVFKNFDIITIPEIVPTDVSFDLFGFALDHPARSKSDTYYVDEQNILRPHDTVMWYYYLNLPEIKAKIAKQKDLGVICYGKVYRKDEIDRKHMNVFHQMGGLYLVPDSKKTLTFDDLKNVLGEIVKNLFGVNVKYRFNPDTFPYTDPSLEVEVGINGQWVEILGGGMPRPEVLANFGLKGYNGWAFGFGLERLAIISLELPDIRLLWSEDERVKRQLKLGQKYKEVSKYPTITRDISFVVPSDFIPNNYFDLIRDLGGELIEEVTLLDKFENEQKFGAGKISYTYRLVYRSTERTLTTAEIEPLQEKIIRETKRQFVAEIR